MNRHANHLKYFRTWCPQLKGPCLLLKTFLEDFLSGMPVVFPRVFLQMSCLPLLSLQTGIIIIPTNFLSFPSRGCERCRRNKVKSSRRPNTSRTKSIQMSISLCIAMHTYLFLCKTPCVSKSHFIVQLENSSKKDLLVNVVLMSSVKWSKDMKHHRDLMLHSVHY